MKTKWPQKQWILGHRGARNVAPENTISAFKQALIDGADGVELDVFLSKDEQLVVIHDESVDRTTDGSGQVCDFTAKELAHLNAAANFSDFASESVPTLEQVLNVMPPKTIINIEIKHSAAFTKAKLVKKLMELLRLYDNKFCIIISSFDVELLILLRKAAPNYLISLLLDKTADNELLTKQLRLIKPDGVYLSAQNATALLISFIQFAGVNVAIWTVNDAKAAKKWFSLGVNGIFTDKVKELVKAV
ncbi:MAG: glycerophosphodiester phosphodiesterase family protein [bacterium]|nr:glycerophosphodiester phosphodiesterase family protein [bacterium]